ncbi:hypothetical protein CFK37_06600 [Virgibacillus phasianinus]|uniref:Histidine phosphatase family protein n=1 Tax=Virgibacillus phasianinus TaxID=2017483 RepID=A0A220U1W8_9BACI|nr:histidine phosphatase family protein [Virgibacillus phasianinus]ASK61851.1 hypothetical protein CFK37_06600 [Virgibacillus phasianinus]
MDDCMAITLLRHGMTKENQKSAYIGWTDSPLSEQGKSDVKRMHEYFPEMDMVFSSDLKRCLETAALAFPNQLVQCLAEIREIHFGAWEGKTYAELQHLPSYRHWIDHPFRSRPDGGESFEAFCRRIQDGFTEIRRQIIATDAKETAIVTHGGVIRYLLSILLDQNTPFFQWHIPYGGGYRLCWTKDSFRRDENCMLLQEVPTTENQRG